MCGRYTNTVGPEEIERRFGLKLPGAGGTHRYNIAPTEQVLAVVAPHGEPEARLLRWGLLPHWARDARSANKMINARLETVASSPAYRPLLATASGRALQIADGWYEWLKAEQPGQPRQPFLFSVDGGAPFAFAALWTRARIGGETVASIALLTCDAAPNAAARAIHDRMPVVLADRELQRAWLDGALGGRDVLAFCGALPTRRVSARPVNPAVNRAGGAHEGPELLVAPARCP